MRKPLFAGYFYPKFPVELEEEIKKCFYHEKGPGELPTEKRNKDIKGVIVPHAGIIYSGPCAAWSYKEVAEAPLPDTYIILAPNHNSFESGIGVETFETPFGYVRADQHLAHKIVEKGTIDINNRIHEHEHSIEVQLPWLQFINKHKMEKVKILPILVSGDIDLKQLSLDIKESIIDLNRKVIFIISSDFTHYGAMYRYLPFTMNPIKQVYELDGKALEIIKEKDAKKFLEFIDEHSSTICGAYPIALGLMLLNNTKVRVEQYYTSAEITGDKKNFVAYASIIFEGKDKND